MKSFFQLTFFIAYLDQYSPTLKHLGGDVISGDVSDFGTISIEDDLDFN